MYESRCVDVNSATVIEHILRRVLDPSCAPPTRASRVCCAKGHPLSPHEGAPWNCDAANEPGGCLCGGKWPSTLDHDRWRCTECDYDLCDLCHSKRLGELDLSADAATL